MRTLARQMMARQTLSDEEKAMSEIHEVTEQQVRERAYALWEEAGSPTGREVEFWRRAHDELTRSRRHSGPMDHDLDEAGEASFPASDPVNRT